VYGLGTTSCFSHKDEVKSGRIKGRCRTCQKGHEKGRRFYWHRGTHKTLHKRMPCSNQKVCLYIFFLQVATTIELLHPNSLPTAHSLLFMDLILLLILTDSSLTTHCLLTVLTCCENNSLTDLWSLVRRVTPSGFHPLTAHWPFCTTEYSWGGTHFPSCGQWRWSLNQSTLFPLFQNLNILPVSSQSSVIGPKTSVKLQVSPWTNPYLDTFAHLNKRK
jgi:hypothetical protein